MLVNAEPRWLGPAEALAITDGVPGEFSLPNPGSGPRIIAAGADGNLWFSEHTGNRMGRITPTATGATGLTASGANKLAYLQFK